jgi:hypothetical protein
MLFEARATLLVISIRRIRDPCRTGSLAGAAGSRWQSRLGNLAATTLGGKWLLGDGLMIRGLEDGRTLRVLGTGK